MSANLYNIGDLLTDRKGKGVILKVVARLGDNIIRYKTNNGETGEIPLDLLRWNYVKLEDA
ncbi:hypothetical protein [Ammoniphilus sp. YIM 78166]|uniref:hypothetical protein n=1 Tax=Ammoniphilus sp. YIM 78166 TaxID=1644106 RepID=UPI0010702B79|nr:hypothetical protein [Ammoniphilus sp. YIM 78166]